VKLPGREKAVAILSSGREEVLRCLEGVPAPDIERPATIGGGGWSAKDLIGHLTAWERLALDTIRDWRAERPLRADELVPDLAAVDRLNAAEIARRRAWTLEDVLSEARAVQRDLVEAIRGLTDADWTGPVGTGAARPLGDVLGRLLGAPRSPFGHAGAHLPELRRFAEGVRGG
jgi:hypothetical protein